MYTTGLLFHTFTTYCASKLLPKVLEQSNSDEFLMGFVSTSMAYRVQVESFFSIILLFNRAFGLPKFLNLFNMAIKVYEKIVFLNENVQKCIVDKIMRYFKNDQELIKLYGAPGASNLSDLHKLISERPKCTNLLESVRTLASIHPVKNRVYRQLYYIHLRKVANIFYHQYLNDRNINIYAEKTSLIIREESDAAMYFIPFDKNISQKVNNIFYDHRFHEILFKNSGLLRAIYHDELRFAPAVRNIFTHNNSLRFLRYWKVYLKRDIKLTMAQLSYETRTDLTPEKVIENGNVLVELKRKFNELCANLKFLNIPGLEDFFENEFTIALKYEKKLQSSFEMLPDITIKKCTNVQNLRKKLKQISNLVLYVPDVEQYCLKYVGLLAKRLLYQRTSNIPLERWFLHLTYSLFTVDQLKAVREMFKEAMMSQYLYLKFKEVSLSKCVKMSLVSEEVWPGMKEITPLRIPRSLHNEIERFQNDVFRQHVISREFKVQPIMGIAHVRLTFYVEGRNNEKDKIITCEKISCNTAQLSILTLFKYNKTLCLEEIIKKLDATNTAFVVQNLRILMKGGKEHCLIKKSPDSRAIKNSDIFELNLNFRSQALSVWEIEDARMICADIPESCAFSVNHLQLVDAFVTRELKLNKTYIYSSLIAKVLCNSQEHFQASVKLIKHRIEKLIERGYITRDYKNRCCLIYLY